MKHDFRDGDAREYDEFYRRYFDDAVFYLHLLGWPLGHAERCANKVFTRMLNRSPPAGMELAEWVFTLTRREGKARLKRACGVFSVDPPKARKLDLSGPDRALFGAIMQLPKMWREACFLTVMKQLTDEAAARVVGVTENEIREWTADALEEITAFLRNHLD